LWKLVLQ